MTESNGAADAAIPTPAMGATAARVLRARGNAREIVLTFDFGAVRLRDTPRDIALLAGLAARFPGRDALALHELRGLEVEAEINGDPPRLRSLGVRPGPAELSRARALFFGRRGHWHWDRHPSIMRVTPGARCVYCGAPATDADHIEPVAHGGEDTIDNKADACARCNRGEGASIRLPGGVRLVEVVQLEPRVGVRILTGDGRGRVAFPEWPGAARGVWRVWMFRSAPRAPLVVRHWEPASVVRPSAAIS